MVEAVLCMAFLMDILGIPVEMSRSTKMNEEKMREAMAEVKKKMGPEVDFYEGQELPAFMVDKLILEMTNEIQKGEEGWRQ